MLAGVSGPLGMPGGGGGAPGMCGANGMGGGGGGGAPLIGGGGGGGGGRGWAPLIDDATDESRWSAVVESAMPKHAISSYCEGGSCLHWKQVS